MSSDAARALWSAVCAAQAQIARRIGAVHVRGAAAADGSISTQAWLTAWADHGPTSLTNLTLLCPRHHTMIHEGGWRILLNPTTAEITTYRPGGTRHDLTSTPRGPTRAP